MAGPEDNPADDELVDREAWEEYEAALSLNDHPKTAEMLEIAKRHAAESPYKYTKLEAFEPHPWVIQAMLQAFEEGVLRDEQYSAARNLLVQQELDEHYREAQTSIIRATVAAVLESMSHGAGICRYEDGKIHRVSITMNLEAQATIWDRFELETIRSDDEKNVTFSLHRK